MLSSYLYMYGCFFGNKYGDSKAYDLSMSIRHDNDFSFNHGYK